MTLGDMLGLARFNFEQFFGNDTLGLWDEEEIRVLGDFKKATQFLRDEIKFDMVFKINNSQN